MTWATWSDFVAMGGHAPFVWGSFGITALAIAGELLSLRARRAALAAAPRHIDFGSPHEA